MEQINATVTLAIDEKTPGRVLRIHIPLPLLRFLAEGNEFVVSTRGESAATAALGFAEVVLTAAPDADSTGTVLRLVRNDES